MCGKFKTQDFIRMVVDGFGLVGLEFTPKTSSHSEFHGPPSNKPNRAGNIFLGQIQDQKACCDDVITAGMLQSPRLRMAGRVDWTSSHDHLRI